MNPGATKINVEYRPVLIRGYLLATRENRMTVTLYIYQIESNQMKFIKSRRTKKVTNTARVVHDAYDIETNGT